MDSNCEFRLNHRHLGSNLATARKVASIKRLDKGAQN